MKSGAVPMPLIPGAFAAEPIAPATGPFPALADGSDGCRWRCSRMARRPLGGIVSPIDAGQRELERSDGLAMPACGADAVDAVDGVAEEAEFHIVIDGSRRPGVLSVDDENENTASVCRRCFRGWAAGIRTPTT